LLDTGSEVTLMPTKFVPRIRFAGTTQTLRAANGTQINVRGKALVRGDLGGEHVDIPCLVNDHVSEVMLGLDWLHEHDCLWDFSQGTVKLDGRFYPLYGRRAAGWVRRCVLAESVVIPPRSEVNAATTVVLRSLETAPDWMTEPRTVKASGVCVARTLVPNRGSDVPVRLLNLDGKSVRLDVGTVLSDLRPAEVVGPTPATSEEEGNNDYVTTIMARVDPQVAKEGRDQIHSLLMRYRDVFSQSEYDLGQTGLIRHRIETGDARPIRQSLRRFPPLHLEAIKQQTDEMIQQGIIEPVSSEWASNVVLARKKDGTLRFCVDYRRLNACSRKDAYPLPRIDACLDAIGGTRWFSTFHLRSGYHQVMLHERDADKTTFLTREGTFRLKAMPFGLCGAPATFQRLMDLVMAGLNNEVCLVYLDDIIVFSREFDEHQRRLQAFFERLRWAKLKLKPSKCWLLQKQV
jgi:hypothetical protein